MVAESDTVATPITISERAAKRLLALVGVGSGSALRVSVKGGGCSGFQYTFEIEQGRSPADQVVHRNGATVIVDPVSLEMLRGAEVDFVDDLMGQSFRVKNPNARSSCGCGVSFSL